jgi:hypothetical protein
MKRLCLGSVAGIALVLLFTPVSSAATIQEVMAQPFNPTSTSFIGQYGNAGYLLSWSSVAANGLFNSSGSPTGNYTGPSSNPAWLDFGAVSSGSTGGSGGGGAPGTGLQTTYNLGTKTSGAWEMDFSVLIFDPQFQGSSVSVELLGSADGSDYKAKTLTTSQVNGGTMLTWHIEAADGEDVIVRISSEGGQTYAAGFFMDNPAGAIPEPATLLLVGIGLVTVGVGRRR